MDSIKAGVAFTANPLNSDRDELVVDASWGLGESVVDGSVTADRYLYDKVHQTVMERTIGTKTVEKRIHRTDGGVETKPIADEAKQTASTLTDEQIEQLAKLAALVEEMYGMPMDIEWAYIQESSGNTTSTEHLKLLQARPITTLFYIDDNMMTAPGERRVLYYDYNVVSDATTTDPFTRMDMNFYGWASTAMMLVINEMNLLTFRK
jgi:phosphoenolpyruvate synthase/pyruvate phosphate dikinase